MFENPVVILTRECGDNGPLLNILEKKGIKTLEYPCIKTTIIPYKGEKIEGHKRLMDFNVLIFTSKRSVYGVEKVYQEIRSSTQLIAVVGDKTSAIIKQRIGRETDLVANPQNSEALAKMLITKLKPKDRILHIRGNKTSGTIKQILEKNGHPLYELIVYKHETPDIEPLKACQAAIVVFASPSAASHFFQYNDSNKQFYYIAIGPVTSNYLKKIKIPKVVEANNPYPESIVNKILQICKGDKKTP